MITIDQMKRMGIPKLHWYATISEIPDSCPHKKEILLYIKNLPKHISNGVGLLLWGDYSTGKSALASICLKVAAYIEKSGMFIMASEIADAVYKEKYFEEGKTVYDRLLEVDVLVIDELFFFNDQRDYQIEQLIRKRINSVKTTIITTNLSKETLVKQYPALANVLTEAVYPIAVHGYNFRKSISEENARELND